MRAIFGRTGTEAYNASSGRQDGDFHGVTSTSPEGQSRHPRVLVFQESLPDYRLSFLNALGRECALTVCYSRPTRLKPVRPDPAGIRDFRAVELRRTGLPSGLLSWHPALLSLIRTLRPAVIIAEPRLGLLSSWQLALGRKDCQLVWWLSGHEPPESGWRNRLRNLLRIRLYRRADAYIGYSAATAAYLRRLGLPGRVHIAPNTTDSEGISAAAERWESLPDKQKRRDELRRGADLVLLYVGRMTPAKRLPVLLETLERIRNTPGAPRIRLIMVGDGPDQKALRELSRKKGLDEQVVFTGGIYGPERLAPYFKAADLFVLPGKGGLAVSDAVHFGLPVILASADGTEGDLILQDQNGIILQEDSAEAFARAILQVAREHGSLQGLTKEAARRAQELSGSAAMLQGFLSAIGEATIKEQDA